MGLNVVVEGVSTGVNVIEGVGEITEVVVEGPQGAPGPSGVVLLEANQTEPAEDTPVNTIVYRKLT